MAVDPKILEELCEEISDKFPDAQIVAANELLYVLKPNRSSSKKEYLFNVLPNGSGELHMRWDFRKNRNPGLEGLYSFKEITASCNLPIGDIVVGGLKKEFIPKAVWNASDGKNILEDAIVIAYKDPFQCQNVALLDPPTAKVNKSRFDKA